MKIINLFIQFAIITMAQMSFAQTKVIELKSDKSIYNVGDIPVLKATLFSKPDNSDFQFDVSALLNDVEIKTDRITDFQIFSAPKNLSVGTYNWVVTVVIQDARFATDLKSIIKYYDDKIIDIDTELLTATDPNIIADLMAKKTEYQNIISASQQQLNSIRTPVLQPVSLQFTVQ